MSKGNTTDSWRNVRQAVFARDRDRCLNCRASDGMVIALDPHHGVPRGSGGADRVSNVHTYCRRCHDAIHNETAIAPCVKLESTGDMTNREFGWFKHFVHDMIPVMSQIAGHRIEPKHNLGGNKYWYLPVGNVVCLDEKLTDTDVRYTSADLAEYI